MPQKGKRSKQDEPKESTGRTKKARPLFAGGKPKRVKYEQDDAPPSLRPSSLDKFEDKFTWIEDAAKFNLSQLNREQEAALRSFQHREDAIVERYRQRMRELGERFHRPVDDKCTELPYDGKCTELPYDEKPKKKVVTVSRETNTELSMYRDRHWLNPIMPNGMGFNNLASLMKRARVRARDNNKPYNGPIDYQSEKVIKVLSAVAPVIRDPSFMGPKYKLTYFNGRGLAEVSRLILAYAEVDYIDERLSAKQWANKKSFMFMRLPMLSFDGVTIRESRAIARFLAKEYELVGKDDTEAARCDMLVDEFYDIYPEINRWRRDGLVEKLKQNLVQKFVASVYPEFLKRFSHLLYATHPNETYYRFVGTQVTWADIALAHGFWELMRIMEPYVQPSYYDDLNRCVIVNFVDKILSIPSIKAWIDKRPKTDF